MYFDQLLDFPILLLLFLHSSLLCHILLFRCWIFSIPSSVKQFGSWSGSKLFAKVISRQQKSPLAGKELNTKKLVDTTFGLQPWLKLISFGSNFFIWLKCWLQHVLSRGKPWAYCITAPMSFLSTCIQIMVSIQYLLKRWLDWIHILYTGIWLKNIGQVWFQVKSTKNYNLWELCPFLHEKFAEFVMVVVEGTSVLNGHSLLTGILRIADKNRCLQNHHYSFLT